MKRFLRFCSMILTVVMVLNMLPLQSFAVTVQENISADDTVTSKPTAEEETIVGEIVSARSEYSKEYLLSNGLHMAKVYSEPVHYEKDGAWEEIDNTLKRTTAGTYSNTAGLWNVQFPQKMGANAPVTITKDGYTLSFAMAGELRQSGDLEVMSGGLETASLTAISPGEETYTVNAAQTSAAQIQQVDLTALREATNFPETVTGKQYSQLLYPNVYAGTNIRYDLDSTRVKESIILSSYSSALRGYRYTLNTGGLVPVLAEDGQIDFYDAGRENIVMTMPAPFLVDEAMEYSYDVQVQLTGSGSTYTLTYLLPRSWLASSERQWPVILDPVVKASTLKVNIEDITVSEGKTYSRTWGMLQCGHSTTYGLSRFYVKFKNLPQLTSSDVIVQADVWLYKHASGDTMQIEAYKVLGTWSDTSMTWSNQPAYNDVVEDYTTTTVAYNYGWTLTDLVRSWYDEGNNGVMFKVPDHYEDVNYNTYRQFRSVDYGYNRPTLEIKFRNNNGLEEFWDYTPVSAGRAGTGHINNLTGNLTWIRDDMGFGGNLMPVSIQHIYNANDSLTPADENNSNNTGGNYFGMGYGWRTNFNQRVFLWETDPAPETDYYVWEDEDGTDRYFKYVSSGLYQDENYPEYTLSTTGSGSKKYALMVKNGSTSYFDTYGRLTSIVNNQQTPSDITITYTTTSGPLIQTITDGANRVYRFEYNTNGMLTSIDYYGSGSTKLHSVYYGYIYSNLTSVTDNDGKSSHYAYNSANILMRVTDVDGHQLDFTYNTVTDTYQPYRVKVVSEHFLNDPANRDGPRIDGGQLSIEYSAYQTTFTDVSNNKLVKQFDIEGNAVAVHDDEGRAQVMQFGNVGQSGAGKGHQLTLSSKLQNSVSNWFTNSSFETEVSWSRTDIHVDPVYTDENSYYGSHSMKMVRNYAGAVSGIYGSAVSVGADETYTFSAYVKTGDGSVYIDAWDGTDAIKSESLAANSEWTRLQVTYENKSGSAKQVTLRLMTAEVGISYIDCIQAEEAPTASRYNLCENGNFEAGMAGWTGNACTTVDTVVDIDSSVTDEMGSKAFRIIGNHTSQKQLSQTVNVSGAANDTFVFAGWAKGDATPKTDTRRFALQAVFTYTDGTTSSADDKLIFHFNPDTDDGHSWQYGAIKLVAAKNYSAIKLQLLYDYNVNTVYFDGIQLYKEEFGTSVEYNNDGTVSKVVDTQKQTTNYEYNTKGELTKAILPTGITHEYGYDGHHNVTTIITKETASGAVQQTQNFTYDNNNNGYGNLESQSVTADGITTTVSYEYTDDQNRLESVTDAAGNTTTYCFNAQTNELEWVQYPGDSADNPSTTTVKEGTATYYTYDEMFRQTSATAIAAADPDNYSQGETLSAEYTFEDDLLTKIQTASTAYNFTYGDFSLNTGVKVGEKVLATYNYTNDRNKYLQSLVFGNGDSVEYEYDNYGRLIRQSYEDGDYVTCAYDNLGNTALVFDSATGLTINGYYDFTGRKGVTEQRSGTELVFRVSEVYDTYNRLTSQTRQYASGSYTDSYAYNTDGTLQSMVLGNIRGIGFVYDGLNRVTAMNTGTGSDTAPNGREFTYRTVGGSTTSQISKVRYDELMAKQGYASFDFDYTYDESGNIVTYVSPQESITYTYDTQNQLLSADSAGSGTDYSYTYDDAGNILTATKGGTTYTYAYTNSDWGDLLTAYNGTTIGYDDIGNPTSYYNGWSFTWEHGREMATASKGDQSLSFTYDVDGLRKTKTVGGVVHTYYYSGSKLVRETYGDTVLDFFYDQNGHPFMMVQGANVYYYITNAQGDVIQVTDVLGQIAAEYQYDPYGNTISATGSHANINPLRYRGYYYDTETGLYYLQSRYYDPNTGRFINADNYTATGQGFGGNNMFAYCNNNAVMYYDPTGHQLYSPFPNVSLYSDGSAFTSVVVINNTEAGWRKGSEKMGKDMADAIGAGSYSVENARTDTFSDTWSDISAEYVIFHTHGSPNGFSGEEFWFRRSHISALQCNSSIKFVLITACSVGGDLGTQANAGQLLSQKIAPDGIVICSTTTVRGNDTNFWPIDEGYWVAYQNGKQIELNWQTEITMYYAAEYWKEYSS